MWLRGALLCSCGLLFLLLAPVYLPIIGPLLGLLTPLPFVYCLRRWGPVEGLKSAAISMAVAGLFCFAVGEERLLVFVLEFGCLGLALAEGFRRGLGMGTVVVVGTGVLALSSLALIVFFSLLKDTDPHTLFMSYIEAQLKKSLSFYRTLGGLDLDEKASEAFLQTAIPIVSQIYPSLMLLGSGFLVWVNVIVAKPLFRLGGVPYPVFAPGDRWSAPERMVWLFIVCGFGLFVVTGALRWVCLNVFIVTMAVYFFHGLSIVMFFLNKYRMPRWGRIAVYGLLGIQQLSMVLLALAGLFDQWADFRRLRKRKDETEQR